VPYNRGSTAILSAAGDHPFGFTASGAFLLAAMNLFTDDENFAALGTRHRNVVALPIFRLTDWIYIARVHKMGHASSSQAHSRGQRMTHGRATFSSLLRGRTTLPILRRAE
jgi:hypothetical protein